MTGAFCRNLHYTRVIVWVLRIKDIIMTELSSDILLNSATDVAVIATDLDGIITVFNTGAEALLGHQASQVIGSDTPLRFFEESEIVAFGKELGIEGTGFELFKRALDVPQLLEQPWTMIHKDGSPFRTQLTITPIQNDDEQTVGYIFMATKPVINTLNTGGGPKDCPRMALGDIPDHEVYERVLEREFKRMQRYTQPIALIKIDVDHFKSYQSTYGEEVAQESLEKITHILQSRIQRAGDFLAFNGFDEFAIVLPNTDIPGAVKVSEFLRLLVAGIEIEHSANPSNPILTISLGIACTQPQRKSKQIELEEQADKALKKAKSDGRNCSRYNEY